MKSTVLDHLIAFLFSSRSTRIYRKILWSRMHSRQKGLSKEAFRQHLYRLNKKGIIKTEGNIIYVNQKDIQNFSVKRNSIIKSILPNKTEKILISFDIPETKKKTRDWLRNQIKYWDFEMIHKSLWLGYGSLPEEFIERLKKLGIYENVRIFKTVKNM
jgi:DNA-binding transcriptional regulator PaaX